VLDFNINLKTKIYFGTDIVKKALDAEHENICGTVLIVTTGKSLIRHGYVDALCDILKNNRNINKVLIYDNISGNPKLSQVKEAVQIGKQSDVKIVIGFGGGSAIDAAKAVAVGIGTKNNIEDYLFKGRVPEKQTLPIIAIPTTSGTGSELSKGAIITSDKEKIKTGIRGENIIPQIAIVDALYTLTVPVKISMETGFDVLAHAIESYVSVKSNIFSEMLSEKAIKIVGKYLSIIKENPDNIYARKQLSYASMIMGINLANVGTCLPHRMQYPIGGITDTSHAAGLAALYPSWVYHEYSVNDEKINNIFEYMGLKSVRSAGEAKEQIKDYLQSIDLNYNLAQMKINHSDVEMLCDKVTGNIKNDKLADIQNIVNTIFCESI
jgi:alcohol dehydrogenase class IV